MRDLTPIGVTNWRNQQQLFGIKDADRLQHIYCIGKTGTGKSTLLLNMAVSDIERGKGVCVIDPHGDLSEMLLHYIPQKRIKDVIYFNAADIDHPIVFNPLHNIDLKDHPLVTSFLIATFKKLWIDSWGPRLEHILRFCILSLLKYPSATLLDIQPLLTDASFRYKVLSHVTSPLVLSFWNNEFNKYSPALRSEAIAPILNKVGLLIASAPVRNIIGQEERSFDIYDVMDNQKILICNLSKGQVGEEACAFLGSLMLTAIQSAAIQRARFTIGERVPFYLYVDEMHSFITQSVSDVLAESRKYALSLFLTHQYIEQIDERIRAAIFGNIGTMISFRVGAEDAIVLAKEFYPILKESDLVTLPQYAMYIKLMIDGTTSKPFSAETVGLKSITSSFKNEVIKQSRELYSTSKEKVEEEIYSRGNKISEEPTLFT